MTLIETYKPEKARILRIWNEIEDACKGLGKSTEWMMQFTCDRYELETSHIIKIEDVEDALQKLANLGLRKSWRHKPRFRKDDKPRGL